MGAVSFKIEPRDCGKRRAIGIGQIGLMRATVAQSARVHESRTCILLLPMEEQPQRRLPNEIRPKSTALHFVAF